MRPTKAALASAVAGALGLISFETMAQNGAFSDADWRMINRDLTATRFSPLDQINTSNVEKLEKVWEYHTGDLSDGTGDRPSSVW